MNLASRIVVAIPSCILLEWHGRILMNKIFWTKKLNVHVLIK